MPVRSTRGSVAASRGGTAVDDTGGPPGDMSAVTSERQIFSNETAGL